VETKDLVVPDLVGPKTLQTSDEEVSITHLFLGMIFGKIMVIYLIVSWGVAHIQVWSVPVSSLFPPGRPPVTAPGAGEPG
jgi:hypothetical protein